MSKQDCYVTDLIMFGHVTFRFKKFCRNYWNYKESTTGYKQCCHFSEIKGELLKMLIKSLFLRLFEPD